MEMESPSIFLMVLITLLLMFVVLILTQRAKARRLSTTGARRPLPRGSSGWPAIGETLDFISCSFSPCPESFMNKRRLMYGKVFRSHLFGCPTIVSTDAEFSRIVLQSDARAFVPWYPKSLTELMGKSSILLINGSLQKRVHGLIGAFFKSPELKAQITADMQRHVRRSMARWHDGQLIRIQDETKQIVFQILAKVLIGLEPGGEMDFLKRQFQEFIAGLMSLPVKFPGSRLYRSLQAKKNMVKLVEKIIHEKRKSSDGLHITRDVIDVMINDASDWMTDDLISDNMIDLMIPAEDSVPVLITLAIKYLSDCPLALRHLEEENMQSKRKKSQLGESLHWSDYMSLSFTQDVITETLRLGSIISGIMRTAVKDMEVRGHFIPKGWCVFMYFRSVHLDESHYEDPNQFNPWRWKVKWKPWRPNMPLLCTTQVEEVAKCCNKDMSTISFTPFGGGQRLCPGLDLARLEASIFLHHLVTDFTWAAEKDYVVNFPTVRMKARMPIRITRRKNERSFCELMSSHV